MNICIYLNFVDTNFKLGTLSHWLLGSQSIANKSSSIVTWQTNRKRLFLLPNYGGLYRFWHENAGVEGIIDPLNLEKTNKHGYLKKFVESFPRLTSLKSYKNIKSNFYLITPSSYLFESCIVCDFFFLFELFEINCIFN